MNETMDIMQEQTQTERKYWLHRISHEADVSYKLLEEGWLTIGWSDIANSGIEDKILAKKEEKFDKIIKKCYKHLSRSRWSLWRFFEFKEGDFVVVPQWGGTFSVYEVIGQAMPISKIADIGVFKAKSNRQVIRDNENLFIYADDSKAIDLGFAVKVKEIKKNISRYGYAEDALTKRMKVRQTTANISDLDKDIQKALNRETPIDLYAEVIEELAGNLLEAIKTQLTPDKFERLIKWYFIKRGATNAYIPAKKSADKQDGADADIVADFEMLKIMFYVQAKKHDDITAGWAVEQISKYKEQHERFVDDYTVVPWVVSTADEFSAEAIAAAQDSRVRLIAGKEFARMLIGAGITNINQAFEK